jgi:hypothetical protein
MLSVDILLPTNLPPASLLIMRILMMLLASMAALGTNGMAAEDPHPALAALWATSPQSDSHRKNKNPSQLNARPPYAQALTSSTT